MAKNKIFPLVYYDLKSTAIPNEKGTRLLVTYDIGILALSSSISTYILEKVAHNESQLIESDNASPDHEIQINQDVLICSVQFAHEVDIDWEKYSSFIHHNSELTRRYKQFTGSKVADVMDIVNVGRKSFIGILDIDQEEFVLVSPDKFNSKFTDPYSVIFQDFPRMKRIANLKKEMSIWEISLFFSNNKSEQNRFQDWVLEQVYNGNLPAKGNPLYKNLKIHHRQMTREQQMNVFINIKDFANSLVVQKKIGENTCLIESWRYVVENPGVIETREKINPLIPLGKIRNKRVSITREIADIILRLCESRNPNFDRKEIGGSSKDFRKFLIDCFPEMKEWLPSPKRFKAILKGNGCTGDAKKNLICSFSLSVKQSPWKEILGDFYGELT